MKQIGIVGAGYVGLVTGACFAEKGHSVVIIERNPDRINMLNQSKVPFYEPGLEAVVQNCVKKGTLSFVSSVSQAFEKSQPTLIFSCVGTPSLDNGAADLSQVWDMAAEIGEHLSSYAVIINKSTVPVGTAHQVKMIIQEKLNERGVSLSFDVASNPEFLKEGDALSDSRIPDRIVIGVDSSCAEKELRELYEPLVEQKERLVVMRIASSELTKYASNAMLATRISFMNQVALLAEKVGADIDEIKNGMSYDKRIGGLFLNAGIGYGGSCFPKDVRALIQTGKEFNQEMSLVSAVDVINVVQRSWFMNKIIAYYHNNPSGKIIGLWGLSFKPETDDIRDAPSLDIIKRLLEYNCKLVVYDPVAMDHVKDLFGDKIAYAKNSKEVLELSDALVIATEWKEFLAYEPIDFRVLTDTVIFDARNCFCPLAMEDAGVAYFSVGRQGSERSNIDQEVKAATINPAKPCLL